MRFSTKFEPGGEQPAKMSNLTTEQQAAMRARPYGAANVAAN
jgi:hypothetical protein